MSVSRKELLVAARDGKILEAIQNASVCNSGNDSKLFDILALLHNEGDIDLLKAFTLLYRNNSQNIDFFITRHIFEKILPQLNAEISVVIECVLHLLIEAGNDLAAGTIIDPYISFLTNNPLLVKNALDIIIDRAPELNPLIVPTFVAGSRLEPEYYFNEALNLTNHPSEQILSAAIFSLGRITYPANKKAKIESIKKLHELSNLHDNDNVLASVIKSASSLARQYDDPHSTIPPTITAALQKGGTQTLHAATEEFGLNTSDLPPKLLQIFLENLQRIKPEHKGSIRNIDFGINHLFKEHKTELAIECLERLLIAHPGLITIKDFQISANTVLRNNSILNHLMTKWFLTANKQLCLALSELVTSGYDKFLRLAIDNKLIPKNDPDLLIFIARKAVGYFFDKPKTAASIIISALRETEDPNYISHLTRLLFDPLLINFPGTLRPFYEVEEKTSNKTARQAIADCLENFELYISELRAIPEIPELQPSAEQKLSFHRDFNKKMRHSYLEAMKNSLVSKIATTSVLLYGRAAVKYLESNSGASERIAIPLRSQSIEMEYPRRNNYDPFGLDYMLRIFRAERIKQK